MENKRKYRAVPGSLREPGVEKTKEGYQFTAAFPADKEVSLLLYQKGKAVPCAEIPMPYREWNGQIRSVLLEDFPAERYEYNYLADGRVVHDPRARILTGRKAFGEEWPEDPHQVRCGFLAEERPESTGFSRIPLEDLILYKVHVRGYTRQKNSRVKNKGTFAGLQEKIPYWKELGINGVELMPAYEFEEIPMPETDLPESAAPRIKKPAKVNYWGYTGGYYYAPKRAYSHSSRPDCEFRALVEALHQAGMECVMEFYFAGEMPPMEIVQILRFWKTEYHIDGFHLLGDAIPQNLLLQDPLLQETKLFFTGIWDEYKGSRAEGEARRLAEYSAGFSQCLRRLLKGDEGMVCEAALRMRANPPGYGVVNYMVTQDGFTMADLVSYDQKHNEANGEENRDGSECNASWNCGTEGPSRKPAIRALRKKQMRNAWLLLLLSQGTPLLYGGDEFCNSQDGNNNAYCQDNETGWVDWQAFKKNEDMVEFVKQAIAFRKSRRILHMPEEFRSSDYRSLGYPDLSYHSQKAWYGEMEYSSRSLGIMYCCAYAEEEPEEQFLYAAYNFYWEPKEFALPKLPDPCSWRILTDTSQPGEVPEGEGAPLPEEQKSITVPPRTILVLAGK